MSTAAQQGIALTGPMRPGFESILTPEALAFVAALHREFAPRIDKALEARSARQAKLDSGEERFDFLASTADVRKGDWKVAPLPKDILDRRVEITGPVDRKMIINALNSGASVFMADFEDANSPTWENCVNGQINLRDAVRRAITFESKDKKYALNEKTAVLFVRPRGLHLLERHAQFDGKPARGPLFDFGLFFFHNAKEQLARGTGPYFYLPKLESHLEARIWNDVFVFAQKALGIPNGSIKATVLIETLPAAFEMDEILYELKDHSAGLNCGRWDYIFSFIKKRRADAKAILPDRALVTMDKGFLRAYSQLVIQTCHKRGVHAMGGMAAQIPIKNDAAANDAAMAKVRADKERESRDGHDGTWVAHPGLVPIAKEIFDAHMKGANQIDKKREDVHVTREDLLQVPEGPRTEAGLRHNVRVGVQYLEAWLRGEGCVPLYNLMEDAATAEISRAQVWQWQKYGATVDGSPLTKERLAKIIDEECKAFSGGKFADARAIFEKLSSADQFEEFLTLPAYERIVATE
ncbi:MAG: malate synthase A [Polyangiales bacterium]